MAGYPYNTQAWRRLRAAKLATEPLCRPCRLRGRTVLGKVVDHIVPITAGGPAFPPLDGLQPMCQNCHNAKIGDEKAGRPWRPKGCTVDGSPIGDDDW